MTKSYHFRLAVFLASVAILPTPSFAGGFARGYENPHHHDSHIEQVFGTPHDQSKPSCCPDHCQLQNHVRYIKDYFPYFYDIVTENSPKSTACNNNTLWNGLMEFSAIANLDIQYSDRSGGPAQNSLYGVGVRPLFDFNDINVIGSLNNINLFVDAAVNNWVTAHFDFAYVNGSRRSRSYAYEDADWGSVYRSAAGLRVNQAYLLFANPAVWPVFVKIGRINHPFGDYEPFAMSPTLTQLSSEIRTGGAVVGAVFENGLYGEAIWSMSQTSLENFNGAGGVIYGNNKDRNYGFKLGFRSCLNSNLRVHVNGAYIADMRDVDYFLEGEHFYNVELRKNDALFKDFILLNTWARMSRAAGMSLHGSVDYCGFGLSLNYVTALSGLNGDNAVDNSRIRTYEATGYANFHTFRCPSKLTLSYQAADNANIYAIFQSDPTAEFASQLPPPALPPGIPQGVSPLGASVNLGRILPCHRWTASYRLEILRNVQVALQWVHDVDFSEPQGTDRASNYGLFRVSAQL